MTCTWGAWWHLPAAFFGTLVAIFAHELTHYVGMWPIAEKVELHVEDWGTSELYVESEIIDVHWRHRWADVVGAAPLLISLLTLAVWWATDSFPGTDMLGLGAWNMLLWYGFLGGLSDYSRDRSEVGIDPEPIEDDDSEPLVAVPDGGQQFVEEEHMLVNATLVAALGGLTGFVYQSYCAGLVGQTGGTLGNLALMLAAGAIGLAMARFQTRREEEPKQE
jgi:hypothetical protein